MLYPMYFTPETFAQANPVLTGMQAGAGLMGQMYQNQILGAQAQYAQPTLQQELLSEQLKNQTSQIQNKYLPQQLQSGIGLTQAQTGLTGAQTGLTQAETQFFPETTQAKLLAAMGQYYRGMYYNNPAMWAKTFQNNPEFQSLIANNPALASNFTNIMANAVTNPMALMGGQGIPGMGIPGMMGGQTGAPMAPGMNMPQQGAVPMQGAPNQQQLSPQQLPLNPNQINSLAQMFPQSPYVSPSDVGNVQNAAGSALIQKTVPGQIQTQRYYDQSVRNLMGQVAPEMPEIASFAGLAGKAKMTANKYASAFGLQNSDAYQKFNNFASVQAPLIANEARRAFGGQATDSEREVMDDLANPVWVKSNPQLAVQHFNTLASALEQNSKALTQTGASTLSSLQSGMNNPIQAGQQPNQGAAPPITKKIGKNSYIKLNGQWYQQ